MNPSSILLKAIFVVVFIGMSCATYNPSYAEDIPTPTGGLVPTSCQAGSCGLSDLNELFQKVMNFLLVDVMTPLAALAIAFAGFQYFTAVGNPSKLARVHEMFIDILWGIFLAIAAWLIIETIFSTIAKVPFVDMLPKKG